MELREMRARWVTLLAGAVVVLGPGCQPYRKCDPVDDDVVKVLPERLTLTGLYDREAVDRIAAGVRPFRPRFELWSDGAAKRRFVWLPPDTLVDTRDPDDWQFPVGTKFWKEFTRDGVRVETRLLQRQPEGWLGVAYLWLEDGSDAVAAPHGAIDALGTPHDVPAATECGACHGGRSSHALGFSAVQLASPMDGDSLDLEELTLLGLVAPAATPKVPGNETEQAALGYLHANCSHCHNASRPSRAGSRCFDPESDLDFSLRADEGSTAANTRTYRTAIGEYVQPRQPSESRLLELVAQRGRFKRMPPLATELVDGGGVALLTRWIEEMP
jgi:hypothetical protein